jgi:hypothetical protein
MATPPARSMPYRGNLCPFNYARMYIAWHAMDDQKRIVEKLVRQTWGGSNQLLNFI